MAKGEEGTDRSDKPLRVTEQGGLIAASGQSVWGQATFHIIIKSNWD